MSEASGPLEGLVGFDSEWDDDDYYLSCFAYEDGTVVRFDSKTETREHLRKLAAESTPVAVHNARADFGQLGYWPENLRVFDTLMLSWLYDVRPPHGLKPLSEALFGRKLEDPIKRTSEGIRYVALDGKRYTMAEAPQEEVVAYCSADAETTRKLAYHYWGELDDHLKSWYLSRETALLRTTFLMEHRGLPFDEDAHAKLLFEAQQTTFEAEKQVYEEFGYEFNLGSPLQLGKALFQVTWDQESREVQQTGWLKKCEHNPDATKCKEEDCSGPAPKRQYVTVLTERKGLGLRSTRKTESGQPSTDDESLTDHKGHPAVDALLAWREASKVLNTYLLTFPDYVVEGRLHGSLNPTGTATGRFSSSNPNLQNIPARGYWGPKVRSLFAAKPGKWLVVADLDQVEYRVLGDFSRDPNLVQAFRNNEDVHTRTANLIGLTDRQLGKTLGYCAIFGGGPKRVSALTGKPLWECKRMLEDFYSAMPSVADWKQLVINFASRNGYVVTKGGRRRHLDGWSRERKKVDANAERQAVNTVIQGSAADIMRLALPRLAGHGLLCQVHDEVLLETDKPDEACQRVIEAFEYARTELGFSEWVVRTEPKVVSRWSEAK